MALFKDLVKDIKADNVRGCYILYGDEPFFIDEITKLFLEKIIPESEKTMCEYIYYGRDISGDEVKELCVKIPMSFTANPRQLIVVKEAQDLKKLDALFSYMESPSENTILVLAYKNTSKLSKKIPKQPTIFKSSKLNQRELPSWIKNHLKSNGYTIEDDAVTTILDYSDNKLDRIAKEMEKVMLSVSKAQKITKADIQKSVGISKEYTIYNFQEAIGNKNVTQALKIVSYYSQNEKLVAKEVILGSLGTFFSQLYTIKLCQLLKYSTVETASELGLSPSQEWIVTTNMKYCNKFSIPKLEDNILYLSEVDLNIKGQKGPTKKYSEILKEVVLNLV